MELEVVRKLIKKHISAHSALITDTQVAERYYRNKNDILNRAANTDEVGNPLRTADNRICNNFHGLLVNQKASYLFTAPPLFDVGDDSTNKRIAETLGDNYPKVCKDLCINASNAGIAWLHYWINAGGQFKYAVIDSKQVIPIWSTQLEKELLGVFRTYTQIDEDTGDTYEIYEYWNNEGCQSFRKLTSTSIETGLTVYPMFTSFPDGETNSIEHSFGRVPFIPFMNNNIVENDLVNIKGHSDTYDSVYSGFANDLEDIQEIIFVLAGYEDEDLGVFLNQLKKYKTIKTNNYSDSDKSGLSTLSIDIPVEAREKLLEITRKAIFEKGQGVDPQQQDFGNASGVALKFMYSLLELKAGLLETEFRLGFGDFIRAICQYLRADCKTIIQTWTRTAITNDTEAAEICKGSYGILSDKTILANHPFVENVQAEIKEIEDKRRKELDSYGAFPLEA
ncbi:phage portal protein [Acetobacterium fimetarium]|uniref:Phage portal protein n=1 Tax=Acetobacterium fimetarium TaxID=52691 RepID=A0ABR6WVL4_9FIRM|nr:phage portal protein [Acetobacterium fimetarium]MBC3804585.1 phage portal protein [Acetobacterium fimetarium]